MTSTGHTLLRGGFRIKTMPPSSLVGSISKAVGCLCPTNPNGFIRSICVPARSETALYISSRIKYGVGYLFYVANGRKFAGGLSTGRVLGRVRSLPRARRLAGVIFVKVNRPLSGISRLFGMLRVLATSCKCT